MEGAAGGLVRREEGGGASELMSGEDRAGAPDMHEDRSQLSHPAGRACVKSRARGSVVGRKTRTPAGKTAEERIVRTYEQAAAGEEDRGAFDDDGACSALFGGVGRLRPAQEQV